MPGMVLAQVGSALPQLLQNMQNMGFFLYLFPFLLSLAIFYGLFSTLLKDKMQKSAISLVSIVLAFFVMLWSSWNPAIVSFFANLSGVGLILISGFLFLIMVLEFTGFKLDALFKDGDKPRWAVVLIFLFILLMIFFGLGAGSFIPLPAWSSSSELWTVIFFIAIVAMAMSWMSKGDK